MITKARCECMLEAGHEEEEHEARTETFSEGRLLTIRVLWKHEKVQTH